MSKPPRGLDEILKPLPDPYEQPYALRPADNLDAGPQSTRNTHSYIDSAGQLRWTQEFWPSWPPSWIGGGPE